MKDQKPYAEQVNELKAIVSRLPDEFSANEIEQTAIRLEGLNYTPPVISPLPQFLRLNRHTLLEEIDRIVAMPEQEACALAPDDPQKCEDLRLQFIRVVLYHYEKLLLLRQGDANEWDEIDELYVHD